jgi:outer membrane murein-binding lipoprotein Lpp
MADEKKPKIDLKARLGKGAAGGATPPPPQAGGAALPVPAPSGNVAGGVGQTTQNLPPGGGIPVPTPTAPRAITGGGLPVPPGIPVGPPPAFQSPGIKIDPSNPLAAAMAGPAQPARAKSIAPPQPQRIEVDELTVQEARKGARKQGLIAGMVVGVVLGAVGYIAGGASAEKKTREQSAAHAKSLATDVQKSREQLKTISDKVEAGRNTLGRDHKFPDTLAKDLASVNVEFDGSKLAGVRFSGFSTDTTTGLIEYITGVQTINDRKNALINILNKLQKPISDQIKAAAENKPPPISFVVLMNKDSQKNSYAVLAPLQKPITDNNIPAEFLAVDPISKSNVSAPKLTSLDRPGAAYVVPKSLEAAIPNETAGQIGQLVSQLTNVINEIQGEKPPAGQEIVVDTKPGLLQRADKLVEGLNKVQ